MTDDERIIREALQAVPTSGPWYLRTNRHTTTEGLTWGWLDALPPGAGQREIPGVSVTWERGTKSESNAHYIAACSPDRITRLLAEIERLRAENEATEKHTLLDETVRLLSDTLAAVRAELADAKPDAERYRWLRDQHVSECEHWTDYQNQWRADYRDALIGDTFDDAIDAAIKEETK